MLVDPKKNNTKTDYEFLALNRANVMKELTGYANSPRLEACFVIDLIRYGYI